MVKHTVFGVERNLDIAADVFPSADELQAMEEPLQGCEHGWFDSVYDGAKLHYRRWLPSGGKAPKAIVFWMHGIQSHSGTTCKPKDGRKLNVPLLADVFGREDYAVYAFDQYGHGFSEGTRFLIPSTYEVNLQDFVAFINLAVSKHDQNTPVFLMGESYGSTLIIHAARLFQENPAAGPNNFKGFVVDAPAIIADMPPYPVYVLLRYVLAPAFPRWVPFFMPNPISADRIWKDPEVLQLRTLPRRKEMNIDGSGRPFRLGTAVNLVRALEDVRNKVIPGLKQPYCIIHGTDDEGVLIAGSEYMWETTSTADADRDFFRVQGGYHDLLSEPGAMDVANHALHWMKQRLGHK